MEVDNMIDYRRILELKHENFSNSVISNMLNCSRNTIAEVVRLAKKHNLEWPISNDLTNNKIEQLFYPNRGNNDGRAMPDFEWVFEKLSKKGVTLSSVWLMYCEQCEAAHTIPYQRTQFTKKYRDYAMKNKATMRITHKPGETMEVDWVGDVLYVTDSAAMCDVKAYFFVATLSCSQYTYVEAFPDMKMDNWIKAHINAYAYFGGATKILVPDNLKTGVTKNNRNELIINRTYQDLADHYDTVIIPARPRTPRDKPAAEGMVKIVENWILAKLKDRKFFSFAELNYAVKDQLSKLNRTPFQKRNGSRYSAFFEEEKDFLTQLPSTPFDISLWKKVKVPTDYLVTVDEQQYSVPYEYIGKTVDVKYSSTRLDVFFNGNRIASHVRVNGHEPVYVLEHMPMNHRKYLLYNEENFVEWAEKIGHSTSAVINTFLSLKKEKRYGFRYCIGLMKLSEKYSADRLESACTKALKYTSTPEYKTISAILRNGSDLADSSNIDNSSKSIDYAITRGSKYYGGGDN